MPRGSAPGERRGGRQAGTPNKLTPDKKLIIQQALDGGESPLETIFRVMRGDRLVSDRQFAAATAAAPYVHPRLSSTELRAATVWDNLSFEQLLELARAAGVDTTPPKIGRH